MDAEFESMAERLQTLAAGTPDNHKHAIWTLFSRSPGEGGTTLTIGLARALARSGGASPLVIGFDARHGGAARRMGARVEKVMSPDRDNSEISKYVSRPEENGPSVLTLPENFSAERGGGADLEPALQILSRSYSPLLVDAGSLQSPLALRLCRLASLRVLVVDSQRTTSEELARLGSQFEALGQQISAVILNKRENYVPRFLYRGLR